MEMQKVSGGVGGMIYHLKRALQKKTVVDCCKGMFWSATCTFIFHIHAKSRRGSRNMKLCNLVKGKFSQSLVMKLERGHEVRKGHLTSVAHVGVSYKLYFCQ